MRDGRIRKIINKNFTHLLRSLAFRYKKNYYDFEIDWETKEILYFRVTGEVSAERIQRVKRLVEEKIINYEWED